MGKISNVFFDLDGTLLNSYKRLYDLFINLTKVDISYNNYWVMKRQQKEHAYILSSIFNFSETQIREFNQIWLSRIESEEYLRLDVPFEWVDLFLANLKPTCNLYIVTARQSKCSVEKQLAQYDWFNLIDNLLVTEHRVEKKDLIKPYIDPKINNWIVGDTGKDIEAGKILGIKTAAVLSGFRNRSVLERYHPDIIIENARILQDVLSNESTF